MDNNLLMFSLFNSISKDNDNIYKTVFLLILQYIFQNFQKFQKFQKFDLKKFKKYGFKEPCSVEIIYSDMFTTSDRIGYQRITTDYPGNMYLIEAIIKYIGNVFIIDKNKNRNINCNYVCDNNRFQSISDYYLNFTIHKDIEIYYNEFSNIENGININKKIINLRSGNNKYIDDFLNDVKTWYDELRKPKDYRYIMFPEISDKSINICVNKYKLTDSRTFDNYFIPNKFNYKSIINNLINNIGKYSIEGVPKKLGILLHGEPGCGKTTFIKVLSNYTKRHVVNISLEKIKTNKQLFSFMYNLKYEEKTRLVIDYDYSKLIFVLEDIDAISDIVLDRSIKYVSDSDSEKSYNKLFEDFKKEIKKDSDVTPENSFVNNDNKNESKLVSMIQKFKEEDDKLNLSGILNILDGIIDTDNRIVIITTNHIDKLDPALIRPGRIDKIIKLDYIRPCEVIEMLNHFFPDKYNELSNNDKEFINDFFINNDYTPATLEGLCIEKEHLSDVLEFLKN